MPGSCFLADARQQLLLVQLQGRQDGQRCPTPSHCLQQIQGIWHVSAFLVEGILKFFASNHLWVYSSNMVLPSVCAWERERERGTVWMCVCVWERESERLCECVCERERVCVFVCVCETEREKVCVSVRILCVRVFIFVTWLDWWLLYLTLQANSNTINVVCMTSCGVLQM